MPSHAKQIGGEALAEHASKAKNDFGATTAGSRYLRTGLLPRPVLPLAIGYDRWQGRGAAG